MADDAQHKILTDKPLPNYLDFNDLREEGITHLGNMTGKLWTDYNIHDPGITILEALCYALLDLDYRIKLPIEDLLARDPSSTGPDDDFYSPAQILGCNPLTILDYRKLLLDIDGVKNAWLEIATDQKDTCIPPYWRQQLDSDTKDSDCTIFLNGLYHVYLELQTGYVEDDVKESVKKALTAHRNLCEDFCDIFVLCPLDIGVCADIELDATADTAQTYVSIINALNNFLSPSPKFYTLQQLLDKKKSIDEIFAGRPYTTKSHGFIDTEELEDIQLKKEIHLSDVYNVIFGVAGVKTIRNLQLKSCSGPTPGMSKGWKFQVPKYFVPEFSTSCSGFRFTRNGKQLALDTTKYDSIFAISQNKILYQTALPYLDAAFPKGSYRSDLDDYYSIQNDFPNVYGISKGGTPATAPIETKANVLQLKGYLLFFDQLLANYLTQLKSIRSLFSMSSPAGGNKTYFLNPLTNWDDPEKPDYVPDVNKLWRLFVNDDLKALVGAAGNSLAFPVSKKSFDQLLSQGKLSDYLPEDFTVFDYAEWDDIQDSISLLKTDFSLEEEINCQFVQYKSGCWYYYIVTTSDDIVLISQKNFPGIADAKQHAAYLQSCAMFDQNYSVFSIPGEHYTFTINVSNVPIPQYVQSILEDEDQYAARRMKFLDHLLSRFAESFTDYALLLYGSPESLANQENQIEARQKFLSNYPDLSSNRGKAYDYLKNNWNNKNTSGFEKKVKALSGIENWKRHDLCHFVVTTYEEQYLLSFTIGNEEAFTIAEKFNSEDQAKAAATKLIKALCVRSNYSVQFISHEKAYGIDVIYAPDSIASFVKHYDTDELAKKICNRLWFTFTQTPNDKDVFISSYIYRLLLKDHSDKTRKTAINFYNSEEEARNNAQKAVKSINQQDKWQSNLADETAVGTLYMDRNNPGALRFIDIDAFNIDINDTIVGKPGKFTYELLNVSNAFKFLPANEFDDQKAARTHAYNVLLLGADLSNYMIAEREGTNRYTLSIYSNENAQAISHIDYTSSSEAEKDKRRIHDLISHHVYTITINQEPYRWKFQYHLGYEDNNRYRFISDLDYEKSELASAALTEFIKNIPQTQLQKTDKSWVISPIKKGATVSSVRTLETDDQTQGDPTVLLSLQQEIDEAIAEQNPSAFADIKMDELSQQGRYVYQLVDKEEGIAVCTKDCATAGDADIDRKKLIAQLRKGVKYLQVCQDGDILKTHKDECDNVFYHFIIKAVNELTPSGHPLALFESVLGYLSPDDAIAAFKSIYLQVIDWASNAANYGTKISLTEKYLSPDSDEINPPVVFVPVQTKLDLGGTDADVIKKLVAMAQSFPIRIVEYPSDKFNQLFCKKKPIVQQPCDYIPVYKYYYRLEIEDTLNTSFTWQSIHHYDTEAEARAAFSFFIMLLKYTGNLYIDCYYCREEDPPAYRIWIREVLAESVERFSSEEDAWGDHGVEKFICAEQTCHSIHAYQRATDCCYSFFVTCGPPPIIHPCLYDTPNKRNVAKEKLYRAYVETSKKKAFDANFEKRSWILTNSKGTQFATILADENEKDPEDKLFDAIHDILTQKKLESHATENNIEIVTPSGVIIRSIQPDISFQSLKEDLENFVYYFPIIRNDLSRFAIELKLSGFNTHQEDKTIIDPCGNDPDIPGPPCYVGWKGTCDYDNYWEARDVLETTGSALSVYDYYRSSFECDCHSFGIKLSSDAELIALNPQCYTTRDEACDAIQRADEVVNAEGLHVVEHILLRSICNEDDCQCRQLLYCQDPPCCHYTWEVPDADPCIDEKNICFIPGLDPYSFIATVVLPAWPKRFRDSEKRSVIENIIYREAPAHVMLRILWLAPHDFCRFETKFKKLGRWLAQRKSCGDDFSVCDFVTYLFKTEFECLPACTLCQPCTAPPTQQTDCVSVIGSVTKDIGQEFTNQIDGLYCWTTMDCAPEPVQQMPPSDEETEPVDLPFVFHITDEPLPIPTKSKASFINGRIAQHRELVENLPEKTKNNQLVGKVKAFLKETDPSPAKFESLLRQVLKNKKPSKSDPGLNKQQVQVLFQSAISYFLDKRVFDGKPKEKFTVLKEVRQLLRENKISGATILKYWNAPEVKAYEPGADIDLIKERLMGHG